MTNTIDFISNIRFTHAAWLLGFPAIMMALDILTGLIYAWITKTFDSAKMRAGLGKKFAELSYIVIGAMATAGLGLPTEIITGISLYIIFMEGMSILENCEKLGAPIPGFVKAVINNVNETLSKDDYESIKKKLEQIEKALST